MKITNEEKKGYSTEITLNAKDIDNESGGGGGIGISIEGFKGNPADGKPTTQIFIEKYDGKTQIHVWNDTQDPVTFILEKDEPIVIARFIPQAWVNDDATDIDGVVEFNTTEAIINMGKEASLKLKDNSIESDNLAIEAQVIEKHPGPFRVEVKEAIADYWNRQEGEQDEKT